VPAIKCRDGYEVYCWHGTRIPAEWINDKDNIDPSLALTHENLEQRRCLAEILGWEKVLSQLEVRSVNKDPSPEIGELLEADLPDAPKSKFLKVKCGTGRTFVLPVPPEMQSAAQANAWTYNIDEQLLRKIEVRT
jgi:hypothetical protein